MANNNQWYIERNDQGKYTATKGGADRASTVKDTQAEAIERAREIDPDAHINVERVRDTDKGSRDKWRRP
jgi:hypothetical protein